jgi:arylsulfatase A-like enzyme
VLIVVSDATRRDALSPYGGELAAHTPNVARIAERGVVFDACYSAANFSGPSYATLLTGRYPVGHGVFDHPNVLPGDNRTLHEVAADREYYSLHFTQHGYLQRRWNYDQGCSYYRFCGNDEFLANKLVRWIERYPDVPFVAFVVIFTPHFPYGLDDNPNGLLDGLSERDRELRRAAGSQRTKYDLRSTGLSPEYVAAQRAAYLLEVERADGLVGRIVDALERVGRLTNTAIVITADHGEAFGEHGFHFCHDPDVYAPVSRVPLIISWPGRFVPGRVSSVVSLVDVMPTVAEWIGGDAGADVDGSSLTPLLEGREETEPRTALCHSRPLWERGDKHPPLRERYQRPSFAGSSLLAARGPWDVVVQPMAEGMRTELFDRAADPDHLNDLWAEHGDDPEVQLLLTDLLDYRLRLVDAATATATDLTEEQREALRALGYLGSEQ